MWVVLLDLSGSMGEPFQAQNLEGLGRVRSVQAQIKIDAAKQSLLIELRRLRQAQVVLLGFRSTVIEIYAGLASESEEFERRLEDLQPDDGTDIATALKYIVDNFQQRTQVLLISDGISDLEKAKAQAHHCAAASIRIDMLIIDPTDEGQEMAQAITEITQGRWDPVTSADQLEKSLGIAREEHTQDLARAEALLSHAEEEYQEIATNIQDQTRVAFSAGYPKRIQPQQRYPLVVYIHLEELQEKIENFLREEIASSGAVPACSSAESSTRIPRGTLITVQPNIADIFANPPRQEVVWLEDYHKLSFDIRYSGTLPQASCAGFIDIFADGVIIGHVPVSIALESDPQVSPSEPPVTVIGNPFTRAFASYSHTDEAIVLACKETYKAFGIHLYVDRDDLLSGQPWRETLQKMIARSDLFQLYWSQAAANSTEVAREWQLALDISKTRAGDFIRPLYWQKPLVTPPGELGHLHFAYLDLEKLRIAPSDIKIKEEASPQVHKSINAIFPVIPLVESETKESRDSVQRALGNVIPFLEHITELRYYPPVTLLVEEYVIKSVRSILVIDTDRDSTPHEENDINSALQIFRSLALAFHTGMLNPNEIKHNDVDIKRFYRINSETEWNDFEHVRIICEGIGNYVTEYLEGKDPSKQSHWARMLNYGGNNTFTNCTTFSGYMVKWFDTWLNYLGTVSSQNSGVFYNHYTVSLPALNWLKAQFPNVNIQITSRKESWRERGEIECSYRVQTSEIYRIAVFLKSLILEAIQTGNGISNALKGYFSSIAHTYGIFASAESEQTNQYLLQLAQDNNWPNGIALSGCHKVLLCTNAFERYKSELLNLGIDQQQVDQMATWFLLSTIVHEHFHGAIATGLDEQGRTSWAVNNWGEWQKGNMLNESLAAWAERHYFRDNGVMFANITEYIQSGPYPDWPYRGADKIEELYKRQGLPGVREMIRQLRDDPQYAQELFDRMS